MRASLTGVKLDEAADAETDEASFDKYDICSLARLA